MALITGHWYYLDGMHKDMWDMAHEKYGQPYALVGLYLGSCKGTRTWHLFEIPLHGDAGVIMMNDGDIAKLQITEVDLNDKHPTPS